MRGRLPGKLLMLALTVLALGMAVARPVRAVPPAAFSSLNVLFAEGFEDTSFGARGWYDGTIAITSAEHIPQAGASSAEYHFLLGARTGTTGGAIRHKFPPTGRVYLSCWVKYSAGWEGSNRPYHPHEFHFVTDLDSDWVGPAFTHLTTYIEQNEGTPLLAIQDGSNIDQTQIGVDLTSVTEQRSVAGCNGDSDGHGAGDCYLNGSLYWNGKDWRAPQIYFTDSPGPYYKNDWHFIEAYFQLNSIVGGKGVADGRVAYWYDGVPVFDHPDVMIRTGANPTMRFAQFLIAPYIGDGSPVDQTMWIDELTVAVPGTSLMRNDQIAVLAAARAAMASIFTGTGDVTLDERGPDGIAAAGEGALESSPGSDDDDDFYVANAVNGAPDPDPIPVVVDGLRPLVLWQVSEPGNRLRVAKDGRGSAVLVW